MKKSLALIWVAVLLWGLNQPLAEEESNASASSGALIGTAEFEVTSDELVLYLEMLAMNAGVSVSDMSGQRVTQAILELYGLKVLGSEANKENLYSADMTDWLPQHLFLTHSVIRYTDLAVARALDATNWAAEAREFYLANPDQFLVPETVTIRTLLLRTEDRSLEEALELAWEIAASEAAQENFDTLVARYSEDEVGKLNGGLMERVRRGQTVPPFEEAAFDLEEIGQISLPVQSEFGVHLIQLVERFPQSTAPFDDIETELIADLKVKREAEYRAAIKERARNSEPPGYFINEDEIAAVMAEMFP